jgi:hypothetical protein
MTTKNNIDIASTDNVSDIVPAKDRVSESLLHEILERNNLERVVDMGLIEVYPTDARFGERWTMQKAICLVLEDHSGRITIAELAYVIDAWFSKPNYGIGRAKTDVRKYAKKQLNCQHPTATVNAAELA